MTVDFSHFFCGSQPFNGDHNLSCLIHSTFPSLNFTLYRFEPALVRSLIWSSRPTSPTSSLENLLNYARTYLADILPTCVVFRVIYLDSDLIVVDDVALMWSTRLVGSQVIAALEYCNANFINYFIDLFWLDQSLLRVFDGRSPCYFNTGVMVMDLIKWRAERFSENSDGFFHLNF